jgi:ABC-type branched-subunit amino acid transport system ATPase component
MNREMLKLENLSVTFGGLKAVDSVSLSVFENEVVSLIGPNGAGKTTTFNAIIGIVNKSGGRVLFDGHDISKTKPFQAAGLGLTKTFQNTCLFPDLTVFDNIRTGCHLREKPSLLGTLFNTKAHRNEEKNTINLAEEILEFIQLTEFAKISAGNMPYGKQRLLKVGIAMACNPKMLLLDEPAAGLNETETQGMMALIKKTRDQGMTVMLVEHDMKMVMGISDRIVVLNFGKKVAEGHPEEIKTNPEVIAAYLGGQNDHA